VYPPVHFSPIFEPLRGGYIASQSLIYLQPVSCNK
jgi:hypothetical protein